MDNVDEILAAMRKLAIAARQATDSFLRLAKGIHDSFHDATWHPEACQFCRDEMARNEMMHEQIRGDNGN